MACCNLWGQKESDTTEPLNWTELNWEDQDWNADMNRNQGAPRPKSTAIGYRILPSLLLGTIAISRHCQYHRPHWPQMSSIQFAPLPPDSILWAGSLRGWTQGLCSCLGFQEGKKSKWNLLSAGDKALETQKCTHNKDFLSNKRTRQGYTPQNTKVNHNFYFPFNPWLSHLL